MWGTILQVAGTALSLFAQKKEADAKEEAAEQNVKTYEEEAAYQEWKGSVDLQRLEDAKNRLVARQRVMYAKAGVQLDQGTTETIFYDTINQYNQDVTILKQKNEFNVLRAKAGSQIAEEEGDSARMIGYLGMGRTLLNSASTIYDSWGK
jgi:hypothetical protein